MSEFINVVLIYPPSDCVEDDHLDPPLGLLYIASVLREYGISVKIYDMTGCQTTGEILDKISGIPIGDIYGISTYCTNYYYAKCCIQHIRGLNEKIPIILGGPNPTAIPQEILNDSACDCVIVGEGEDAFLQVVNDHIEGNEIQKIVIGSGRDRLDEYPLLDWSLIDPFDYTREINGNKSISLISSRGCNHHCAHCNSVVIGQRGKLRFRSAENLRQEILQLIKKGFSKFRFSDDNFTSNPNLKFLTSVLKEMNIEYRVFSRIENLNSEVCQHLARSGCRHVSIGIESLNPDNLRAIRKHTQSGKELPNLINAKKFGIIVRAFFIVGLPYDTDNTIMHYFEEAAQLPFDEFTIYPLIPYPGTSIWESPEKYGYTITEHDFTKYIQIGRNQKTVFALRHKNFTEEDVERWLHLSTEILMGAGKVQSRASQVAS